MTTADKTIYIQDLQCKYASWSTEFNNAIALGKCVESAHCSNITISNLIDVLYRYETWDETVTNAFTIDFNILFTCNKISPLTITNITINGILYSSSVTCLEDYIADVIAVIEAGGVYSTQLDGTVLTIYSIDPSETFSLPEVGFTYGDLTVTMLDSTFVPNINCLTEEEICQVICKLNSLTLNCNC